MFIREFDQAILLQDQQPLSLSREVFSKDYRVSGFNGGYVDESVAHDLVDDVLANAIVTRRIVSVSKRTRALRSCEWPLSLHAHH
jgi:hypothetical protein